MQAETGELFVGAYLRIVERCAIVQYNVHDPDSSSQGETDVLGLDNATKRLFVCEVITHLDGAQYSRRGSGGKIVDKTVEILRAKFDHDRSFVAKAFPEFTHPVFMLWSPYFAIGGKTESLQEMAENWPGSGTLDLRVNERYSAAAQELADFAAVTTKQSGESFFRTLQLLTHLRGPRNKRLRLRLD